MKRRLRSCLNTYVVHFSTVLHANVVFKISLMSQYVKKSQAICIYHVLSGILRHESDVAMKNFVKALITYYEWIHASITKEFVANKQLFYESIQRLT